MGLIKAKMWKKGLRVRLGGGRDGVAAGAQQRRFPLPRDRGMAKSWERLEGAIVKS